jgi:dUTP pyrophosphatase
MKFIKLTETAILPTRGTENSAGYDFCADETVRIQPGGVSIVKTGISFENMPSDQYLQLSLRSSISIKRPFLLANGIGVVDSDFSPNEIGIILYNRSDFPAVIDKGERIAQGILLKYYTEEETKKPTRKRTSGYGSTNN